MFLLTIFKMKNSKLASIITMGFALFAMFFGAGNLILPPYIGVNVGTNWPLAILGFVITGIVAPFLGLLAVTKNGFTFSDLGKRTHPILVLILATIIMLSIGPLVAIPRTAATTFEMALKPIFPEMNALVGAVLFFAVILLLTISPSKIVDIIGKYLTPILVVLLLLLVVLGIVNPIASAQKIVISAKESFQLGFDQGYQTMDVLASVVFAGIIISAAVEKGYTTAKQRVHMVIVSGIVAVSCLFIIYGGLIYLGVTSGYTVGQDVSRTQLLLNISQNILGSYGTIAVSVAIALACLTTAIALTAAFASFTEKLTKGKVSYKVSIVLCTLVSMFFSLKGVDEIIAYAGALLNFVYPITFALVLLILFFGGKVKQRAPYVVAMVVVSILSLISLLISFEVSFPLLTKMYGQMPLAEHNLEWMLATFVVFVLVALFTKKEQIH